MKKLNVKNLYSDASKLSMNKISPVKILNLRDMYKKEISLTKRSHSNINHNTQSGMNLDDSEITVIEENINKNNNFKAKSDKVRINLPSNWSKISPSFTANNKRKSLFLDHKLESNKIRKLSESKSLRLMKTPVITLDSPSNCDKSSSLNFDDEDEIGLPLTSNGNSHLIHERRSGLLSDEAAMDNLPGESMDYIPSVKPQLKFRMEKSIESNNSIPLKIRNSANNKLTINSDIVNTKNLLLKNISMLYNEEDDTCEVKKVPDVVAIKSAEVTRLRDLQIIKDTATRSADKITVKKRINFSNSDRVSNKVCIRSSMIPQNKKNNTVHQSIITNKISRNNMNGIERLHQRERNSRIIKVVTGNSNKSPSCVNIKAPKDIGISIEGINDGTDLTSIICRVSGDGQPQVFHFPLKCNQPKNSSFSVVDDRNREYNLIQPDGGSYNRICDLLQQNPSAFSCDRNESSYRIVHDPVTNERILIQVDSKKMKSSIRSEKKSKVLHDQETDEKNEQVQELQRTRSGRISRPPQHRVKDYKSLKQTNHNNQNSSLGYRDYDANQLTEVSTMKFADSIDDKIHRKKRSKLSEKSRLRYTCKTCNKLYMGDQKLAKHYMMYPNHKQEKDEETLIDLTENVNQTEKVNNGLETIKSLQKPESKGTVPNILEVAMNEIQMSPNYSTQLGLPSPEAHNVNLLDITSNEVNAEQCTSAEKVVSYPGDDVKREEPLKPDNNYGSVKPETEAKLLFDTNDKTIDNLESVIATCFDNPAVKINYEESFHSLGEIDDLILDKKMDDFLISPSKLDDALSNILQNSAELKNSHDGLSFSSEKISNCKDDLLLIDNGKSNTLANDLYPSCYPMVTYSDSKTKEPLLKDDSKTESSKEMNNTGSIPYQNSFSKCVNTKISECSSDSFCKYSSHSIPSSDEADSINPKQHMDIMKKVLHSFDEKSIKRSNFQEEIAFPVKEKSSGEIVYNLDMILDRLTTGEIVGAVFPRVMKEISIWQLICFQAYASSTDTQSNEFNTKNLQNLNSALKELSNVIIQCEKEIKETLHTSPVLEENPKDVTKLVLIPTNIASALKLEYGYYRSKEQQKETKMNISKSTTPKKSRLTSSNKVVLPSNSITSDSYPKISVKSKPISKSNKKKKLVTPKVKNNLQKPKQNSQKSSIQSINKSDTRDAASHIQNITTTIPPNEALTPHLNIAVSTKQSVCFPSTSINSFTTRNSNVSEIIFETPDVQNYNVSSISNTESSLFPMEDCLMNNVGYEFDQNNQTSRLEVQPTCSEDITPKNIVTPDSASFDSLVHSRDESKRITKSTEPSTFSSSSTITNLSENSINTTHVSSMLNNLVNNCVDYEVDNSIQTSNINTMANTFKSYEIMHSKNDSFVSQQCNPSLLPIEDRISTIIPHTFSNDENTLVKNFDRQETQYVIAKKISPIGNESPNSDMKNSNQICLIPSVSSHITQDKIKTKSIQTANFNQRSTNSENYKHSDFEHFTTQPIQYDNHSPLFTLNTNNEDFLNNHAPSQIELSTEGHIRTSNIHSNMNPYTISNSVLNTTSSCQFGGNQTLSTDVSEMNRVENRNASSSLSMNSYNLPPISLDSLIPDFKVGTNMIDPSSSEHIQVTNTEFDSQSEVQLIRNEPITNYPSNPTQATITQNIPSTNSQKLNKNKTTKQSDPKSQTKTKATGKNNTKRTKKKQATVNLSKFTNANFKEVLDPPIYQEPITSLIQSQNLTKEVKSSENLNVAKKKQTKKKSNTSSGSSLKGDNSAVYGPLQTVDSTDNGLVVAQPATSPISALLQSNLTNFNDVTINKSCKSETTITDSQSVSPFRGRNINKTTEHVFMNSDIPKTTIPTSWEQHNNNSHHPIGNSDSSFPLIPSTTLGQKLPAYINQHASRHTSFISRSNVDIQTTIGSLSQACFPIPTISPSMSRPPSVTNSIGMDYCNYITVPSPSSVFNTQKQGRNIHVSSPLGCITPPPVYGQAYNNQGIFPFPRITSPLTSHDNTLLYTSSRISAGLSMSPPLSSLLMNGGSVSPNASITNNHIDRSESPQISRSCSRPIMSPTHIMSMSFPSMSPDIANLEPPLPIPSSIPALSELEITADDLPRILSTGDSSNQSVGASKLLDTNTADLTEMIQKLREGTDFHLGKEHKRAAPSFSGVLGNSSVNTEVFTSPSSTHASPPHTNYIGAATAPLNNHISTKYMNSYSDVLPSKTTLQNRSQELNSVSISPVVMASSNVQYKLAPEHTMSYINARSSTSKDLYQSNPCSNNSNDLQTDRGMLSPSSVHPTLFPNY